MPRKRSLHPIAKHKLLDAALRLMLNKGYTATSVDEICAAAALTKGTFFHYFESKEALGIAVLDHYWAVTMETLSGAGWGTAEDPLTRFYAYLDLIAATAHDPDVPKSCLFGNFSQELSTTHNVIRRACADGFTRWKEMLQRDIELAKQAHAPDANFDSASVAEHFISIFEGSLVLAKATQDPGVIVRSVEHFKRYVASFFSESRVRRTARKVG